MSFSQFPQQPQVVRLLQHSLSHGRLAHAYLLTGSRLEELEALARTLAKVLNCTQTPEAGIDSCDACASCRKIDAENHPDVQWLRPESKSRVITIDQMRELICTVNLKPTDARFKFAGIVAADRLNILAANAFLKTLEEPPARTIFVLLTIEPQRILETILSRCLRLHFAGEGGQHFEPADLAWITEFVSSASNATPGILGRYRLLSTLLARLAQMRATIEADINSSQTAHDNAEPKFVERLENQLAAAIEAEYRRQRANLLLALQFLFRDVWLRALRFGVDLCQFPQMIKEVDNIAQRLAPHDALQNLQLLDRTQRLLHSNVQEALALEVGFLGLKL